MEGFPLFCQRTLITANIITLVKSVEFSFSGATLFVLDPALTLLLSTIEVTSNDSGSAVSGSHIVRLLAVFMLITGPLLLLVGLAGLCGAYRKSTGWLVCYLALLVILITAILTLCAIGIPPALVDPSNEWRPLTDFMLTSIVISLALQGVMIFFCIVLLSALSKEDAQVHPQSDHKNSDPARKHRQNRR